MLASIHFDQDARPQGQNRRRKDPLGLAAESGGPSSDRVVVAPRGEFPRPSSGHAAGGHAECRRMRRSVVVSMAGTPPPRPSPQGGGRVRWFGHLGTELAGTVNVGGRGGVSLCQWQGHPHPDPPAGGRES
jgi:hypothetical protein